MRSFYFAILSAVAFSQEPPTATFGTTVASSSGFRGDIFVIEPHTEELPSFRRMRAVGAIYTTALHVPERSFLSGFPGITDRFEWFAIDYRGRFWVETPGQYRFRLLSDDGSKLYINDKLVVDNDGLHAPLAVEGSGYLTRGVHTMRVSYYQGPGVIVALILSVKPPAAAEWEIFDTNTFKPPPDPAEWTPGRIRDIKRGTGWRP